MVYSWTTLLISPEYKWSVRKMYVSIIAYRLVFELGLWRAIVEFDAVQFAKK